MIDIVRLIVLRSGVDKGNRAMPSRTDDQFCRPFKNLKLLLQQKKVDLHCAAPPASITAPDRPLTPQEEHRLFQEAMADVTPLFFDHFRHPPRPCAPRVVPDGERDHPAVEALHRLVEKGQGFVVAQTSEYMEAAGPGVSPEIPRRLHRGYFAIQSHVDLHGLSVPQAEAAVHRFISEAIREGKRAVLVVHGRGLTSPGKPILKNKVYYWLTRGPLRKHVIALTSARPCDGGTGATYVLLRRRPMTKSMRKAALRNDAAFKT